MPEAEAVEALRRYRADWDECTAEQRAYYRQYWSVAFPGEEAMRPPDEGPTLPDPPTDTPVRSSPGDAARTPPAADEPRPEQPGPQLPPHLKRQGTAGIPRAKRESTDGAPPAKRHRAGGAASDGEGTTISGFAPLQRDPAKAAAAKGAVASDGGPPPGPPPGKAADPRLGAEVKQERREGGRPERKAVLLDGSPVTIHATKQAAELSGRCGMVVTVAGETVLVDFGPGIRKKLDRVAVALCTSEMFSVGTDVHALWKGSWHKGTVRAFGGQSGLTVTWADGSYTEVPWQEVRNPSPVVPVDNPHKPPPPATPPPGRASKPPPPPGAPPPAGRASRQEYRQTSVDRRYYCKGAFVRLVGAAEWDSAVKTSRNMTVLDAAQASDHAVRQSDRLAGRMAHGAGRGGGAPAGPPPEPQHPPKPPAEPRPDADSDGEMPEGGPPFPDLPPFVRKNHPAVAERFRKKGKLARTTPLPVVKALAKSASFLACDALTWCTPTLLRQLRHWTPLPERPAGTHNGVPASPQGSDGGLRAAFAPLTVSALRSVAQTLGRDLRGCCERSDVERLLSDTPDVDAVVAACRKHGAKIPVSLGTNAEAASAERVSETAAKLAPGTWVETFGLNTVALNGLRGQVVKDNGDRVAVELGSSGKKALKRENLREVDPPSGSPPPPPPPPPPTKPSTTADPELVALLTEIGLAELAPAFARRHLTLQSLKEGLRTDDYDALGIVDARVKKRLKDGVAMLMPKTRRKRKKKKRRRRSSLSSSSGEDSSASDRRRRRSADRCRPWGSQAPPAPKPQEEAIACPNCAGQMLVECQVGAGFQCPHCSTSFKLTSHMLESCDV
eukprot:TRINITY_DN1582_c0_g1_i1.p1 TRINITY_DN1582_c0_g1~~TRINITY_DN1582_c0_g1_i1.p1  ORF type:complete len:840 (+),score=200.71 TRINITY_DN1582_c0_g1_i1:61-2580(+)